MRLVHFWIGVAALVALLLTKQFMDRALDHLQNMSDLPRMFYRSRHIYILMCACLHLGLGCYLIFEQARWRRLTQTVGSLALLAAAPLLVVAFFRDPESSGFETPFSRAGLYLTLGGTMGHVVATRIPSRRRD